MSNKRRQPRTRRHQRPHNRPAPKLVNDGRARRDRLAASISRDGFTIVTVGGTCGKPGCPCARGGGFGDEAWSFTIGRHGMGLPELVITGDLDAEETTWIIGRVTHEIDHHDLLRRAAQGEFLEIGPLRFRLDPVPLEWLDTDPGRMQDWFDLNGRAGAGCEPPELLQVVWSDTDGAFPDDPGCDADVRHMQVLLMQHPETFPTRRIGRAS